jgi:hypothetical protein
MKSALGFYDINSKIMLVSIGKYYFKLHKHSPADVAALAKIEGKSHTSEPKACAKA